MLPPLVYKLSFLSGAGKSHFSNCVLEGCFGTADIGSTLAGGVPRVVEAHTPMTVLVSHYMEQSDRVWYGEELDEMGVLARVVTGFTRSTFFILHIRALIAQ